MSDGNPTVAGLLGAKAPHAFEPDSPWRVFVTAQHGDNVSHELIRSERAGTRWAGRRPRPPPGPALA